jgi:serine protease Do
MARTKFIGAATIFALLLATQLVAAGEEVLDLGGGREVRGPVLKETADEVFVDLGYTVLGVPKAKIIKRRAIEEEEEGVGPGPEQAGDDLYRTARLPEGAVRDVVTRVGDAVVKVSTPSGQGSGFIITPQGHVVTNDHVVQGETRVQVTLFKKAGDRIEREAVDGVEIIALNGEVDLALLELPKREEPYPFVYVGSEKSSGVGDVVFAIGNPRGLDRTVSQGIVSSSNRPFAGLTYLQTTTQINPGNSGGPLLNLRGEVVGVTNMKLLFSEGLSFAIPVQRVRWFLENRDAFAYEKDNPNSGYRYLAAPPKPAAQAAAKPKDEDAGREDGAAGGKGAKAPVRDR